jgi:hypothetical protein
MKSKTLQLINRYHRLLNEQGEDPNMQQPPMEGDPNQQPQNVQDVVDPNAETGEEEIMPLTSQGEEKYIADLVDAALFEPSAEDARTLLNLQNVMQMKRFKNAREEVLPLVLSIISSETQGGDLKKNLSEI